MSFNGKHYVAIGLGFVLVAGYSMQKSASPTQPVAFETQSGEFKPLSSFEHSIGSVPKISAIKTELAQPSNPISMSYLATESEAGAQQVTFDTAEPQSDDIDFSVPGFIDDEITPLITPLSGGKPVDSAAEENTPEVDVPTSNVAELETASSSSIIVEPVSVTPAQAFTEATRSVEESMSMTMEINTTKNPSFDLAFSENQNEIDETVEETTEHVGFIESPVRIAPLTIPLSEAATHQAVNHIEYGKSLSRRGAAFAARQEFYSAIRVIAESNDATSGTKDFSRALYQAILAMKEAKDFVQENAATEMLLDVSLIVETHRSKIVDKAQAASTNPSQALQRYFVFAQEKLDQASGRNPVSAEVLFCLGKLHSTISRSKIIPDKIDVARAVAYHQAALMSDSNNFRSANELGVLLVQMGQLEQATELFKRSLIAQPTPQAWQNLAKTHRRMGQQDLAQLAETEYLRLSQTQMANSSVPLRWVPTQSFNVNPPTEFFETKRVANRPESVLAEPNTASEKARTKIKSFGERLKELF